MDEIHLPKVRTFLSPMLVASTAHAESLRRSPRAIASPALLMLHSRH